MNLNGISKLSKDRLLDELKKILYYKNLINLSKDKLSLEIFEVVFPQLKYFNFFSKLNSYAKNMLEKVDFIFIISLLTIDNSDNLDYFLYKFNISKKDQKRLKIIHDFYINKITYKSFTEKNLNRIFYYKGKEAVIDIINFQLFKSKKIDQNLIKKIELKKYKLLPILPIKANILMNKYNMSQGKMLGEKLKLIEEEWVENNFQISNQQVENIINN